MYTRFVHSARTGTRFYHFHHGQSKSTLEDGRAQDYSVQEAGSDRDIERAV